MPADFEGDVATTVAELPDREGLDGFWDLMDARLAAAEPAFLADVGIALRATYGVRPVPNVRPAVDGLVRRLAMLPWPGHVDEAQRLAAGAAIPTRYVASLLATGQDVQDLAPVLDGDGPLGLRACLAQELVLRGRPAPVRMPRGHALSVLPTTLTELEIDPPLPRYGLDWTAYASPLPVGEELGPIGAAAPPPFVVGEAPESIAAAVESWTHGPNNGTDTAPADGAPGSVPTGSVPTGSVPTGSVPTGSVTTGAVELVEPIGVAAAGAVVTALLPLVGEGAPASAVTAWRMLFAAASMGGAHSRGEYGAYGRLAAWRSLGGFVGVGEDLWVAEIERRVPEHGWYRFRAAVAGQEVSHDLGLAALDADGRRLVVLAATDTA